MHHVHLRSAVLAVVLFAGACGGSSATDSAAQIETTAAPGAAAAEESNDVGRADSTTEAPTTTGPSATSEVAGDVVTLVGGGQLDLNSIEGQDTVLWFWAPW